MWISLLLTDDNSENKQFCVQVTDRASVIFGLWLATLVAQYRTKSDSCDFFLWCIDDSVNKPARG